jgi:hypothetical protein
MKHLPDRVRYFNSFNVCTYLSELIVAPLIKTLTNRIASLPRTTLAMTLPAEANTFDLFSVTPHTVPIYNPPASIFLAP